ncbi:MAG TPA: DUF5916 domain-containing protein [Longimicrobiales bacterium]|nr:DUF5916 domain-containing protein [Longimicrobiales bacterium]
MRSPAILPALGTLVLCALPASAQISDTRADTDRVRIGAIAAQGEIRVDGVLDEPVWRNGTAATGFVQAEPREGQPASERTEVRVAYDDGNLYVAARLWDSDSDGLVVTDIKKDFTETAQDGFGVILDTFRDRRNGYVFLTNPEGARADWQVANEGREINTSWDAVWTVRTQRDAEGWTVEMAIPFRALRFEEGVESWGINFSRRIRRKNELAYWSPVPRSYALTRVSLAGDLTGLPSASGGRDLRVKPYVMGAAVRELGVTDYEDREEVGVDLKAGLFDAFTLDLTVNPDFAQVEADVQQVNLTQFSQFFPEKREFFLENSGLFYVGDAARNNRVFATPTPDEDLLLFFSRRVGVADDGRAIPIRAGGRLTGRVGGTNIGAIVMRTDDISGVPGSDYGVLRVRQNVFSGSDVGGIFMMRDARETGPSGDDYNRVYGADANLRFPGNVDWSTYLIGTESPGLEGGQYAWRTSLNREGNFVHIKLGLMELGENFNDDLGFFRRTGVRKYFVDFGLRPRPASMQRLGIREMHPHIVWNYYEDLSGRIVAKNLHSGYTFFMQDGGFWELSVNPKFEKTESPFRISPDIDAIPAGSYSWAEYQIRGNSDPSRVLSGGVTGIVGGLWSGTQKTVNANVTVRPSYRFYLEARVQRTAGDLDVPDADFTRTFWTFRTNYSFSTNMFVDALLQYDPGSDRINTNVRFNLIHHPLSDLFIVFNEQRFENGEGIPPGRGLTIKATQMVAF